MDQEVDFLTRATLREHVVNQTLDYGEWKSRFGRMTKFEK